MTLDPGVCRTSHPRPRHCRGRASAFGCTVRRHLAPVGPGVLALLQEDDHRSPRVVAPGRLQAGHVGDAVREELDAAGSSSALVAAMSSHSMPTWVMPTLVTEGRPGSGGTTPAAGYSISSMTRSSCPEADDGARDDHRRRDELTHVVLDLRALHAVGRRQHAAGRGRRSTSGWRPRRRGRRRPCGPSRSAPGQRRPEARGRRRWMRHRRLLSSSGRSRAAGACSRSGTGRCTRRLDLAQDEDADEDQRRQRRPRCAEHDHAQPLEQLAPCAPCH